MLRLQCAPQLALGRNRMGTSAGKLVALLAAALIGAAGLSAGVTLPQDRGPASVDVSGYPPNIQGGYQLVQKSCGKCHPVARALNTSASPLFWSHYLGNLQTQRKIDLRADEIQKIFDFLMYDQANRKDKNPKAFYPPLTEDEIQRLSTASP
jgi:hypothetical protein